MGFANAASDGTAIGRGLRPARSLVDDVSEAEVAVLVDGRDTDAIEDSVLESGNAIAGGRGGQEPGTPIWESKNISKKISTFASKLSGGGSFSFGSASSASCSTGSV